VSIGEGKGEDRAGRRSSSPSGQSVSGLLLVFDVPLDFKPAAAQGSNLARGPLHQGVLQHGQPPLLLQQAVNRPQRPDCLKVQQLLQPSLRAL